MVVSDDYDMMMMMITRVIMVDVIRMMIFTMIMRILMMIIISFLHQIAWWFGLTPLHLACFDGLPDIINLLLHKGAVTEATVIEN